MGVLKDLGTSHVQDIDPLTGYPRDKYGFLLNPISHYDGSVEKDWNKPGTELVNLTSPYGRLYFACGSGDDFWCFDYETINAGPRGKFIILDCSINSETGSFIQGGGYYVLPCNTEDERCTALGKAEEMVGDAITWCCENDVRHTKSGWNQQPEYFARSVAQALFKLAFERYNAKRQTWEDVVSERQMRHGSKTVDRIMRGICHKK